MAHNPARAGEQKCFRVVHSQQPQGAFFVDEMVIAQ